MASPPALHPLLFSNVLCTGGLAACPGFQERLLADLRPLVPDDMEVRALVLPSPVSDPLIPHVMPAGNPTIRAEVSRAAANNALNAG